MRNSPKFLLGLALAGAPSLASADPSSADSLSAEAVCTGLSVTADMVAKAFDIPSDQPLSCKAELVVVVNASHVDGVIDFGSVDVFSNVSVRNDGEAVLVEFIPESGDPFELRNPSLADLTAIREGTFSDDSGPVFEGPPDRVVFNWK